MKNNFGLRSMCESAALKVVKRLHFSHFLVHLVTLFMFLEIIQATSGRAPDISVIIEYLFPAFWRRPRCFKLQLELYSTTVSCAIRNDTSLSLYETVMLDKNGLCR